MLRPKFWALHQIITHSMENLSNRRLKAICHQFFGIDYEVESIDFSNQKQKHDLLYYAQRKSTIQLISWWLCAISALRDCSSNADK